MALVPLSRRQVLVLGASASLAGPTLASARQARPAALEAEVVRTFVASAHSDLDKTKEMLQANPALLNATWDWGGGDFEAAIGGAGHMGRADIAEFLIGQGARYDLHVAAMLGQLDVVRGVLSAFPSAKDSKGPHGISLVRHAEKGGERARDVLDYLRKLG
ncbi:MAG: hypothetical protein KIS66_17625 [Fimbriimonadaceae bacterium]|nr:hypothetical protein [Fimbriimonadaceae bacterium]